MNKYERHELNFPRGFKHNVATRANSKESKGKRERERDRQSIQNTLWLIYTLTTFIITTHIRELKSP